VESTHHLLNPPTGLTGVPTVVSSARRGALAYLGLVAVLSGAVTMIIIRNPQVPFLVLMCMPALASILVRLARREGCADVSFRFGGRHTWVALLLGVLMPFAVGVAAYGVAWLTGLASFAPPETLPFLGNRPDLLPVARFALLVTIVLQWRSCRLWSRPPARRSAAHMSMPPSSGSTWSQRAPCPACSPSPTTVSSTARSARCRSTLA
jgi:hypothetical protein